MSTKYIASNWRLPNQAGVDSYLNDNYGLTFDGSGENIDTSDTTLLNGKDSFSISCWIKPTAIDNNDPILISRGSSFIGLYLSVSGSNYLATIQTAGSTFTQSTAGNVNLNEWNHIVATGTVGSKLNIYVNNNLENTTQAHSNMATLSQDASFVIAKDHCCGGRYFEGSISEVAIFDYALSSTQINTLYGSSSLGAGNPMALKPAPVAFYPLGDNSSGNPLTQPNEAVQDASVFDFPASNDFISIGSTTLGINTAIAISAWVKTSINTGYGVIINEDSAGSKRNWNLLRKNDDINFVIHHDDTGTNSTIIEASTINVSDNKWHHVVGTWDGTTNSDSMKVYFDGVEVGQATPSSTGINTETVAPWIGNASVNPSGYLNWTGQLSNIQVWNTGLLSSEVTTLYNSGVPLTGTQPQASNLKAWYKLDQSANWEADSSGDWQIPDAVSAYPQSFEFISSDTSQINLGDVTYLDGASELTLSAWVKPTAAGTVAADGIFGKDGPTRGFYLATYTGNKFRFFVSTTGSSNDSFNSNASYTIGEWIHLAATWDGSNMKIYINGSEDNTRTTTNATGTLQNNANPFEIGNLGNYNGPLNAVLSNAQVWTKALSSTQIETLYNNGTPLTTAIASDNLKAWYKLDNTATFSTNWSIPDASGNGNTGTSSGMTEQNLVNNNVSALNGESSGMTSANLVLTDLTRNLPYDSYSFNFDSASSDYIDCGNDSSLEITTNFTISAWVNLNTMTGYRRIIGKANSDNSKANYGLGLFQGYKPGVIANATGSWFTNYSANALSTGVWHHLVGIYDGSNFILYVNGTLDNSTSVSGFNIATAASATSGDSLLIGQIPSGAENFNGKISNVSLFNEALTSTEVMKLYSNGMPQDLSSFTPAPVAWWTLGSNSFFNGSNFICKDLIGSNDGTSVNAGVDALQGNTPRSEANGTGTNMDIPTNLEGTTKYSSNNSWSINMSNTARVQDTP